MDAFSLWYVCNEDEKRARRAAEEGGYEYEPLLSLGGFVNAWDSMFFRTLIILILLVGGGGIGWMSWKHHVQRAAYQEVIDARHAEFEAKREAYRKLLER